MSPLAFNTFVWDCVPGEVPRARGGVDFREIRRQNARLQLRWIFDFREICRKPLARDSVVGGVGTQSPTESSHDSPACFGFDFLKSIERLMC